MWTNNLHSNCSMAECFQEKSSQVCQRVKCKALDNALYKNIPLVFKLNVYTCPIGHNSPVPGNILPGEEIQAHLKYIMDDRSAQPDYPLGVLTTADRDTWTNLRQQLEDAGRSPCHLPGSQHSYLFLLLLYVNCNSYIFICFHKIPIFCFAFTKFLYTYAFTKFQYFPMLSKNS